MNITETTVRSYAAMYTAVELREMLKDAHAKLNTGTLITQVTGPGTSYGRTVTMTPIEAVELYTLAIEYKEGRSVNPVRCERFCDPGVTF